METPAEDHRPLKCPRCGSCNTKFCYYNNYSLSQPRHFCKACKRYWTRGGTLRNVPVGGGCRKNKKAVKQPPPPPNVGDSSPAASTATKNLHSVQQPADHTDLTSRHPFYTNPLELNFPFSGFNAARVSSGLMVGENYENGFKRQIQDVIDLDNINPVLFGSSTKFAPSLGEFQGLMPYEDMQIPGENGAVIGEDTRVGGGNGFGLNPAQFEQINSTDHYSSLLWTTAAWFDPSNVGSSVPSLI